MLPTKLILICQNNCWLTTVFLTQSGAVVVACMGIFKKQATLQLTLTPTGVPEQVCLCTAHLNQKGQNNCFCYKTTKKHVY